MFKKYKKKDFCPKKQRQTTKRFEEIAANDSGSGKYWHVLKKMEKHFQPNIDPAGNMDDYEIKVMIRIYYDMHILSLKDSRHHPKKRIQMIKRAQSFRFPF